MSGDLPKPRMPSGRTPNLYREQYEVWCAAARGETPTNAQHPIDDLLGEHHFLRLVLMSMQTEAVSLAGKKAMDLDFWGGAVDIVGNFGLLLHWRKKANHLFPALGGSGFEEELEALERAQQRDIETTLELCDAVQEGDNEKVVRLVSIYTGSKRRHMAHEEETILMPAREALDVATADRIRAEFDDLDKSALPGANRAHYLEVAEQLFANLTFPVVAD